MLVVYSSSSEEEEGSEGAASNHRTKRRPRACQEQEEEKDDSTARKKLKAEPLLHKTRLPIPGCLLEMFPEEEGPKTEDSSLHGGRVRSFQHERGNWATYVYLPYQPEEDFEEVLEEVLSVAGAQGVPLSRQEELHLSLSQTVVLRHHWIQPFSQSLRAELGHCRRFVCSAGKLKVYCNAERTRTFLGMEVSIGHIQLLELIKAVDRTMTEFHLDTFYKNPSFHISLAWCVGDLTENVKGFLPNLQSLLDEREEGPFRLRLDCLEVRCKAGNKTFGFPLQQ